LAPQFWREFAKISKNFKKFAEKFVLTTFTILRQHINKIPPACCCHVIVDVALNNYFPIFLWLWTPKIVKLVEVVQKTHKGGMFVHTKTTTSLVLLCKLLIMMPFYT